MGKTGKRHSISETAVMVQVGDQGSSLRTVEVRMAEKWVNQGHRCICSTLAIFHQVTKYRMYWKKSLKYNSFLTWSPYWFCWWDPLIPSKYKFSMRQMHCVFCNTEAQIPWPQPVFGMGFLGEAVSTEHMRTGLRTFPLYLPLNPSSLPAFLSVLFVSFALHNNYKKM